MPLFEYVCESCGHRTEVLRRLSDPPLETCPECGGPVKKLLSAPAFQFKGSGWYVTDYAKKGGSSAQPGKGESAGGETSSAASSSAESSGESSSKKTEAPSPPAKPSPGPGGGD